MSKWIRARELPSAKESEEFHINPRSIDCVSVKESEETGYFDVFVFVKGKGHLYTRVESHKEATMSANSLADEIETFIR